jgi:hypothetical protein
MFVCAEKQRTDLTVAVVTPANTDHVFQIAPNQSYVVEMFAVCTAAAATTGFGFQLVPSVTVTSILFDWWHVTSNAGAVSAGYQRDNTVMGLTTAVPTAGANTPVHGRGLLIAGSQWGTCQLRFRPEVAAAATFKAGSVLRVQQV